MREEFRLIYLGLFKDPYLKNLELNFVENSENVKETQKEPFSTLIIGKNGTGKSEILRVIVDIFRELQYQKDREKKRKISGLNYFLKYRIGDDTYTVENKGKKKQMFKNDTEIGIFDLKIPKRILALSFMLNDKFLFFDNEKEEPKKRFYEYFGVRRSRSIAGTKSHLKKIVNSIINSSDDLDFIENLGLILEFLKFDRFFNIFFHPKFKSYFFDGKLTEEKFISFFKNWKERRKTKPFSVFYFNKLKINDIKKLVSFINEHQDMIEKTGGSHFFQYNLFSSENLSFKRHKIREFNDSIKKLLELDILSYPGIEVKKNEIFDLQESGSGEYHFISTMIGIMANIKKTSLVLIDEPEISLHPNWQIKYVDYVKNIFSNYQSCHFIIATHSHFMISDLKKESSSIVSLRRKENNELLAELCTDNTYGRSAEDILYNIFDLRTVRNYYVGEDLRDLLRLISEKSQNISEINRLINKLEKIALNEQDPLNLIIKKAKEYVEEND